MMKTDSLLTELFTNMHKLNLDRQENKHQDQTHADYVTKYSDSNSNWLYKEKKGMHSI